MEKVILDTDIGSDIDDALALAYLLANPECDLLGVTTATGQADLRAEMVSAMLHHAGRTDVPVHIGAFDGMLWPVMQTEAPQAAVLGDMPRDKTFPDLHAVEFMRQTIRANPGEVTLLAIGPMTNLGLLFASDPEIAGMLKGLVMMIGRFFNGMAGEWNAVNDPVATAKLYTPGTNAPIHRSVGLDVTLQCQLTPEECRERFKSISLLEPVAEFAEVWFQHRAKVTFHDPLAAACIFRPELLTFARGGVSVPLDGPTAGWTVFKPDENGPHEAAESVNPDAFFEHYFDVLS